MSFASPKPQPGQYVGLAQRLQDMVVREEFDTAIHMTIAPTHWQQNTAPNVPFDIWQPFPPPHYSHSKYSPLAEYGYARIHTASLFSPQDEILESSRERFVTQPIGSRTPESTIIAPSFTNDHRPSTPYKERKANSLPAYFHERVLRRLRSLKRLQFNHERNRSYSSTFRRAWILKL